MEEILFGTKEWAEATLNLFKGKCTNGCIYCFASADIKRFHKNPIFCIKPKMLNHKFRKKREYVTMYPSTHDINPLNIKEHICFLKNFLVTGSEILIVSKPNLSCIENICAELMPYREQITFRFTIGSSKNEVLKFYEPDAPDYLERIRSLKSAFFNGYKTSLSIEPMLDSYPDAVIHDANEFVTGDIWIGKLNNPSARLKLNGHLDKLYRVKTLANWQSDDKNILKIVNRLSNISNVKWKESIKKVLLRNVENL